MRSSASNTSLIDRPESFQIKGGLFPMNLLEVKTLDLDAIKHELQAKILKAPAFFENAPLVLGFEMLDESQHDQFDLAGLISLCKSLKLFPAASRGASPALMQKSRANQLATLAKGREKHVGAATANPSVEVQNSEPTATQAEPPANQATGTKVVSTPIRSGQQIYASGDLIILSAVSAGAEVLADGNIHIYGPLRGRALAGVKGDRNARIFCASQEAELVSIAGQFMVDDQLKSTLWKKAVQIHCADDNIIISPLL